MKYEAMLQPGKCACTNLRKLTRQITNMYDQTLAPSGLRSTQFSLLSALSTFEGFTINQLGEAMVMDPTTLNRNLKPLEKLGLVIIQAGQDQRTRVVSLSEKGRATLTEAMPLWEQAQIRMVEGLGEEKFQDFLTELQEVSRLIS